MLRGGSGHVPQICRRCGVDRYSGACVLRPRHYGSDCLSRRVRDARSRPGGDVLTQSIAGTLFDQLYKYDYLARPLKLRPLAASAMPSVSSDGREITVSIRQGIRFSDHRAFKIRPRELVAEDFVYSVKRFMDPAIASPIYSLIAGK